jgi:hypothetical protein
LAGRVWRWSLGSFGLGFETSHLPGVEPGVFAASVAIHAL